MPVQRKKPMARKVMKNKTISKTEAKENLKKRSSAKAPANAVVKKSRKVAKPMVENKGNKPQASRGPAQSASQKVKSQARKAAVKSAASNIGKAAKVVGKSALKYGKTGGVVAAVAGAVTGSALSIASSVGEARRITNSGVKSKDPKARKLSDIYQKAYASGKEDKLKAALKKRRDSKKK